MNNITTKILVCCHKKDIMANEYPYMPIQLGKDLTEIDLNIESDNTGDNISYKNPYYCELTGLYWAWKNLKNTDIIGLCHYRRYFDFHKACDKFKPYSIFPVSSFNDTDLTIPSYVLNEVKKGSVVLPRLESFPIPAIAQYNDKHSSIDMSAVRDIIKQEFDDKYSRAIWKVLVNSNKISLCNMFIMNWKDFDCYCNWLFSILTKAETVIDINNYSTYQRRVFGFLAERLLNVWVYAEEKKVMRYPMVYFSDKQDLVSIIPSWKYGIGKAINNTMNFVRKLEHKLNLTP